MAEDINRVLIIGRLTRDSELQYTNSGYALCKFSIAVNKSKKQGDQWIEEPHFFDVTLWGKRGEALNQYLTKGQQVGIEGSLKQDRWEQDGAKRSKVSIDCEKIQLIGSRKDSGGDSGNGGSYAPPAEPSGNYDDNIPF